MAEQLNPLRPVAIDTNGIPIPEAKLYFFLQGTTTLALLYTDSTATTTLTNPVIADANGQYAQPWYEDADLIRAEVRDADDAVVYEVDPCPLGGATVAQTVDLSTKADVNNPTFTGTVTAPISRLTSTTDVSLTSVSHAWQVGPSNGLNMRGDQNEIQALDNGAVSILFLNALGGTVSISAAGNPTTVEGRLIVDEGVRFSGIPTTATGLSAGDVWNDAGTLKIVV